MKKGRYAMLQDVSKMDPKKMDDPSEGEIEFWGLKQSARIDVPCTDLEHVKTVVVRELDELVESLRKIVRQEEEDVRVRLMRVQSRVRWCHQAIKTPPKSRGGK